MDMNRITALTVKYLRKEITPAEMEELEAWKKQSPVNAQRFEDRVNAENLAESIAIMEEAEHIKQKARENLRFPGQAKVRTLPWLRLAIAAVFIGLIATGIVLWQEKQEKPIPQAGVTVTHDLAPGGDRAVLKLADGSTITLDSAHNGLLASQGSSQVMKTANGKLVYNQDGTSQSIGFNEVETPRGGQYALTLPDGTQVWLNAQSSIRFPTAFTGATREVTVTGEAFFKVAKDKAHPFRVTAAGTTIEDLGTEFNIQAYTDESSLQATLVEGAVRVSKGNERADLQPGQQVSVTSSIGKISNVDTEPFTAWKDGLFEFNSADIETIMRALGRWYDVDIKYEAGKDQHTFTGQMNRNAKASEVLRVLSTSGYHFRIDGKTITVIP